MRIPFLRATIILALLLSLSACGGMSVMKPTSMGIEPGRDYAVINIMRPSSMGGAIKFGIWDRDNFVGVLLPKSIIQYKASPGDHLIMARAENWSAVKATVDAGKNYYILAAPRMGVWKARVALSTLQPDDRRLNKWTRIRKVEIDQGRLGNYVEERVQSVKAAAAKYDNGEETVTDTLNPSDGQ
jgi:hypothetical protein